MPKNTVQDHQVLTGGRVAKESDHKWRAELEIVTPGKKEVRQVGSFESIGNASAALETARQDAIKK